MKQKKSLIIISAVLAVLIVAIVAIVLIQGRNKAYKAIEVISQTERNDESGTKYLACDRGVIRYGRDGITALNPSGEILWVGAYTMTNPKVRTAGNATVVYDVNNYELIVYDEDGSATTIKMLSRIMEVAISEQGEVAILLEESDGYRIEIMDPYAVTKSETEKAVIRTYVEEDGYAVSLAISKDGSKLVTSYTDVTGGTVSSKLTFYNFSGVGQAANANRIVGVFPYEDAIYTDRIHGQ